MQSGSENVDWAASLIEGGIAHELVIRGEVSVGPKREIIISFQNFFPAVIELAVAVENAQAAGLQKPLVVPCNAAYYSSQTIGIVRAPPWFAVEAETERRGVIDVGEHPRLVTTMIPAQARKQTGVFAKGLFPIQPEAVVLAKCMSLSDVSARNSEGCLITAKTSLVEERKEPQDA